MRDLFVEGKGIWGVKVTYFFISIIMAVIILNVNLYKESYIKSDAVFGINDLVEKEVKLKSIINLFPSKSLNNAIDIKSLYADDNMSVKALLFSYNGEKYPEGLSLKINEKVFEIKDKPDSRGYVYCYFKNDDIIISNEKANVQFFVGSEKSDVIEVKATGIVEGNVGDWVTSRDGHTLYFYKGGSNNVIVPNFYNNCIVTDAGGYMKNGRYMNILEKNGNKENISRVEISDGIITVGNYFMYNIFGIKEAVLPDSIELIGGAAFAKTSLTGNIVIPDKVREIYAYAFMETDITGISLNKGLERLCSYAFYGCSSLKGSIVFPESLYYLGNCAFYECRGLTGNIVIPSGVKYIGDGAFYNCIGLDGNLILEEGIEEIGELSFGGEGKTQMNFKAVKLPSSLKKIGPYAFQYCTKIMSITLPEGLETICDGAFDHMSGLEDEKMLIPSTVTTIGGDYRIDKNSGYGGHVFYDMGKDESFTAFEVAEGNKYFKVENGVLYSKDGTRMLAYPRGKKDKEFEIPEGIVQIDEMAFSRASFLKRIVLPDSYEITETLPENILNKDCNSLSGAIYTYTSISEVDVKDTNDKYASVNGIVYSKDMKSVWYIPNKYNGDINLESSVGKLEKGSVFAVSKENTYWNNIYIPSSLYYMDNDIMKFINKNFSGYIFADNSIYYDINKVTGKIEETPFITGDVNMDGSADLNDTLLVLEYLAGFSDDEINMKVADTNEDGNIDIIDAINCVKAMLK